MASLLKKFRGGGKRKKTTPQEKVSVISSSGESSHHASLATPVKGNRPLQEGDDHNNPLQEQSPHKGRGFGHSRRHFFFGKRDASKEAGTPTSTSTANTKLSSRTKDEPQHSPPRPAGSPRIPTHVQATKSRLSFRKDNPDLSANSASSPCPEPKALYRSIESANTEKPLISSRNITKDMERISRAAAALDNKGNELFERGQYDLAMATYSKALKLKRRTFHNMLDDADDILDEALEEDPEMIQKTDHKLLVSMATSINNIGYLRQRSGDATPDETMAAYKKSLRIKREILGNDSLSVGKTLNNIGSVHYLKKEYDGALSAYVEALEIMQANLGTDHPDVGTVWSNMGDVYLGKKEREEALKHYRNSLKIRWAFFGEHDPRVVRLLEKIAAIEMGDKMMEQTREEMAKRNGVSYFDGEGSELFDLDMRPVAQEWHILHDQVQQDMQYVDLLAKRMAIDMVKDKVLILRGMRELMGEDEDRREGSPMEDTERSEDDQVDLNASSSSVRQCATGTCIDRDKALKNVKDRLARIRSQKSASHLNTDDHNSSDNLDLHDQKTSTRFGASIYSPSHRPNLAGMEANELKGEVESLRSALVLRKGIDNLRSFNMNDEAGEEAAATSKVASRPAVES